MCNVLLVLRVQVFQITLRKGYSIADLKGDLNGLYNKTGLKGLGMVFLMTDSQVIQEMKKDWVTNSEILSSPITKGCFFILVLCVFL
jgi:hypothetical protein